MSKDNQPTNITICHATPTHRETTGVQRQSTHQHYHLSCYADPQRDHGCPKTINSPTLPFVTLRRPTEGPLVSKDNQPTNITICHAMPTHRGTTGVQRQSAHQHYHLSCYADPQRDHWCPKTIGPPTLPSLA